MENKLPTEYPNIILAIKMTLKLSAYASKPQLKIMGMYVICKLFLLPILSVIIPVINRPNGQTMFGTLAENKKIHIYTNYYQIILFVK